MAFSAKVYPAKTFIDCCSCWDCTFTSIGYNFYHTSPEILLGGGSFEDHGEVADGVFQEAEGIQEVKVAHLVEAERG